MQWLNISKTTPFFTQRSITHIWDLLTMHNFLWLHNHQTIYYVYVHVCLHAYAQSDISTHLYTYALTQTHAALPLSDFTIVVCIGMFWIQYSNNPYCAAWVHKSLCSNSNVINHLCCVVSVIYDRPFFFI